MCPGSHSSDLGDWEAWKTNRRLNRDQGNRDASIRDVVLRDPAPLAYHAREYFQSREAMRHMNLVIHKLTYLHSWGLAVHCVARMHIGSFGPPLRGSSLSITALCLLRRPEALAGMRGSLSQPPPRKGVKGVWPVRTCLAPLFNISP